MPENAIFVGRPSLYGNPWRVGDDWPDPTRQGERPLSQAGAVEMYRGFAVTMDEEYPTWLAPLRGKTLVCWCPLDQPCHADVLLELLA